MSQRIAVWETRGGGSGVALYRDFDATATSLAGYHANDYSRAEGSRGNSMFNAVDDAAAIARVEEMIQSGYYTPTGSKNPPVRVGEVRA